VEARDSSSHTDRDKSVDAESIKKIVDEAIRIYDADKTGKADFALESAGTFFSFYF